jgi:hypothetical protein
MVHEEHPYDDMLPLHAAIFFEHGIYGVYGKSPDLDLCLRTIRRFSRHAVDV